MGRKTKEDVLKWLNYLAVVVGIAALSLLIFGIIRSLLDL